MKSFIVGLAMLGMVGCAGFSIQAEDRQTGAKIDVQDGKFCIDDATRFNVCVDVPVKEEVPTVE